MQLLLGFGGRAPHGPPQEPCTKNVHVKIISPPPLWSEVGDGVMNVKNLITHLSFGVLVQISHPVACVLAVGAGKSAISEGQKQ